MKNSKLIIPHILIGLYFGLFPLKPLYSQDSIPQIKEYKNTIKGMAIVLPLFSPFVFSVSTGYERYINSINSVEIIGSYFFLSDEMGNTTNIISVKPGYNYYFKKKINRGPNFRVGGYLKYTNVLYDSWGNSGEKYGAGLIVGMGINISKSHKCFLDLAFGASLDYIISHDEWFLDDNTTGWWISPRPVIHFARKF